MMRHLHTDRHHAVQLSTSPAFWRSVQRSELRRGGFMLVMIGVLAVQAMIRNVTGGMFMQGWLFAISLVLFGMMVVMEVLLLVEVRRAERAERVLPAWVWVVSTVVECLIPTVALASVVAFAPVRGTGVLTAPPLLAYCIVLSLCVLHLRPALCLLAGVVCGGGHLALVLQVGLRGGAEEAPVSWPTLLTYPAMLMIIGVASSLVSREMRGHVVETLREAAERQRIRMLARDTLIFGLAKLAEYRDTDTGAHLERIRTYCTILAERLALQYAFIDAEWIRTLAVASSMHDIGKVGIADAVLCKPGRLDDAERQVIQRHPVLGHRVLAEILERGGSDVMLEMSAQIAACHHERWDGNGYPAKLAGEAIPLPARIVAVADVYDALTSARVYKAAMTHQAASKLILEGSGTQFDPLVVGAFMATCDAFDAARAAMTDVPVREG